MANQLGGSKRSNQIYELDSIRYLREEDAADIFGLPYSTVLYFAQAAGAVYQLPKITLIHRKQMEKYMNHLHKVPNTGKYVQKKFVRIGEGSITYSIGHHRFIEMARAAGAVYKINEGKVTNELAGRLGMNEEQLFKCAAENTRRLFPPTVRSMNDVMKDMFLKDGMPEEIAEMMIGEIPPERYLRTVWQIRRYL